MNVVGKFGSLITQGVYSVATPFHPFGGAVDIIAVQQQDGSFRSTPWYVRFGKFQGVLKGAEKVVRIVVNGVECDFHMYLDNSGEAYFVREVGPENDADASDAVFKHAQEANSSDHVYDKTQKKNDHDLFRQQSYDSSTGEFQLRDEHVALGIDRLERTESDTERRFYDFEDVQSSFEGSAELSEYGSGRYENLDMEHVLDSQNSSSEVVLVSVDGHILTAPISSLDRTIEDIELGNPQFHLGPGEGTKFCEPDTEYTDGEPAWAADYLSDMEVSRDKNRTSGGIVDQQLEIFLGGSDVEGTQDASTHAGETQVDNQLEHIPRKANKEDVFKSYLQLSELAMQEGSSNSHETGSLIENSEVAEDPQGSSPLKPSIVEDTKDGQSENLTIEHGGIYDSASFLSTTVTEVQFHAETRQEDAPGSDTSGIDSTIEHSIHASKASEVEVPGDQISVSKGESSREDDVEHQLTSVADDVDTDTGPSIEISICRNLLHAGMGSDAAAEAFDAYRIPMEEYKLSMASIIKNENLVLRIQGKYVPWDKAAPFILGMAVYGLKIPVTPSDAISVEQEGATEANEATGNFSTPSGRGWRLWPIPFRRVKPIEHASSMLPSKDGLTDSGSGSQNLAEEPTSTPRGRKESPHKQLLRTNVPTSEQIESLNLKEGQNVVTFISTSRVLGPQKVEAHIYLWKWNARIVISDVDGTITKSDVLGQFMPLVGKDWTHSGIARLFSAIKENGYQLLFLSARAIVQAYLTKNFLLNLKQDGNTLPIGPVVISPDGLFPSLYREVIRRAPHEFKIACLEDIKSLFPSDYNPFYAGFGNRDTDELSYRKIGIPKGKIFIINPKGEVAINHRIDVKSYTSLHTLVNDMFPPTSLVEQEDFNSWNYWKVPLPDIDGF